MPPLAFPFGSRGAGRPASSQGELRSALMARVTDDATARRLRELAAQEAAVTKQRLATRTAAARSFSAAVVRLAEARAAWEAAQAEAEGTKAKAVGELLGSGMGPGEVAELLGISERELRSLRAMMPRGRAKANGATDGMMFGEESTRLAS